VATGRAESPCDAPRDLRSTTTEDEAGRTGGELAGSSGHEELEEGGFGSDQVCSG
jgi:hypothetical protein